MCSVISRSLLRLSKTQARKGERGETRTLIGIVEEEV